MPLFIGDEYAVDTESGWLDEQGAVHSWGVGAQFARQYDAAQFKARILDNCPAFDVHVYQVENPLEISDKCYLQYFAVFEKK